MYGSIYGLLRIIQSQNSIQTPNLKETLKLFLPLREKKERERGEW